MAVKRRNPDQYLLRLPEGLRDRIQAYADRYGRSLNAEIIRILEREFPEPFPLATRLTQLVTLTEKLRENVEGDDVDALGHNIVEIIKGISKGTVPGVDEQTRASVTEWLDQWEQDITESLGDEYVASFDEEELANYRRSGSTAKIVDPGFPDDDE